MAFQTILLVLGSLLVPCALTLSWTTLSYKLSLRNIKTKGEHSPPRIPHAIPWLGSAIDFLTPYPGRFFDKILAWHPRETGAFTITMGGYTTHMLLSASAVQALFKLKPNVANRDEWTKKIICDSMGMPLPDYNKMCQDNRQAEEELNQEFLLRLSAVSELGTGFSKFFQRELALVTKSLEKDGSTVDLYSWLRQMMFKASSTAFMGEDILEIYPTMATDFWVFDRSLLDLVFGVPKFVKPEPYTAQARMLDGIAKWIETVDRNTDGATPDPHNPAAAWEPHWGSRVSRARQRLWKMQGLSQRGRASLELGFLFGLNSNAIPATGWMLFHILDPRHPDLKPRVLKELKQAVISGSGADTELDLKKLTSLPLLQSILHEVMRQYNDTLVTRGLFEDVRLPVESPDGSKDSGRVLHLKKNTMVMAPTWPSHRDATHFTSPPADVFCAERFLVRKEGESEKGDEEYVFSTAAAGSKMWAFGGGKTICPGRVFAKQEIFAAVALVLLAFDLSPADPDKYAIPTLAQSYVGAGTIPPKGDVKVKVTSV